jgi:hypothetical protein
MPQSYAERVEEMRNTLNILQEDIERSVRLIPNNSEFIIQCRRMQLLNRAILLLMEAKEKTDTVESDYKRLKHELEFKECSVCASKPGSPQLCGSCLQNRWTISQLTSLMAAKEGESASPYTKLKMCEHGFMKENAHFTCTACIEAETKEV